MHSMTKLVFIGYPKCSTCKKAYQALCDLGLDATYRDITKENPSKEEILTWLKRGVKLSSLFNTSGQLYRQWNVKEKRLSYSEEQLVELLAQDGMLVKRPIVVSENQIIIGNKPKEYETLLK